MNQFADQFNASNWCAGPKNNDNGVSPTGSPCRTKRKEGWEEFVEDGAVPLMVAEDIIGVLIDNVHVVARENYALN